jgi:hypothetical protein
MVTVVSASTNVRDDYGDLLERQAGFGAATLSPRAQRDTGHRDRRPPDRERCLDVTNVKNQRSPTWTVTVYALCANA